MSGRSIGVVEDLDRDVVSAMAQREDPHPRWVAGVEAAIVYVAVLAYIWWWQAYSRVFVFIPLALAVASHVWRGETLAGLGFRLRGMGPSLRAAALPLIAFTLAAAAAAMSFGTIHRLTSERLIVVFAHYAPWGIFQQYALNAYFANRLAMSLRDPGRVAAIAAAFFAGAHTPNWLLMGVTLLVGYVAVRLYLAHRNLLVLGLAHAFLGTLLALGVPKSITHGLKTGPSEWRSQRAVVARLLPR